MDPHLAKFLEPFKATDREMTHTSVTGGKYFIHPDKIEEFWEVYTAVSSNPTRVSTLTEVSSNVHHRPVVVDVDLEYDLENGTRRRYTRTHVESLVRIYQTVIREVLEHATDKELTCIVLEKDKPRSDGTRIRDGFHLHFPFCVIDKNVQKNIMHPRVVDETISSHALKVRGNTKSIEQAIEHCVNKPWLMYGSRKGPGHESWKFSYAFNSKMREITQDDVRQMGGFEGEPWEYMPRLLSLRDIPMERVCRLKPTIMERIESMNKRIRSRPKPVNRVHTIQELQTAKELLGMLSTTRRDTYEDWFEVGCIMFNIAEGGELGLRLWTDFSRPSPKFVEGECERKWDSMELRSKGMGSLKHFAKSDSPDAYIAWNNKIRNNFVAKSVESQTHLSVARVIHSIYETRYAYAGKTREWYEFRGHRWYLCEQGISLQRKLQTDIIDVYWEYHRSVGADYASLQDRRLTSHSPSEKDDASDGLKAIEEKRSKITKLINRLGDDGFQNRVMSQCSKLFQHDEFYEKLDTNPNLLGFENGILDLEDNRVRFRHGNPEDYLTLSTGVDFLRYEDGDPDVEEVYQYFRQVFPDEQTRKYFLRKAGTYIAGRNFLKHADIWTGEKGDNSKSTLASLFERAFGPYCVKLPSTYLFGRQTQSSAATPELDQARNARIAFVDEAHSTDMFNTGNLKKITGNDSVYSRGLWKGGGKFIPLFKLIVICNKPPAVENEKVSHKRIRIIPFIASFTDDAPDEEEEQMRLCKFPRDQFFEQKIERMIQPLFWILVKEYKAFVADSRNIAEPPQVTMATHKYRQKNDVILEFINECTVEDPDSTVAITPLFNMLKQWIAEAHPEIRIGSRPKRDELTDYLNDRWGERVTRGRGKNVWLGHRIQIAEEEENVGEAFEGEVGEGDVVVVPRLLKN